jgi:hypothetical protein
LLGYVWSARAHVSLPPVTHLGTADGLAYNASSAKASP